jgi:hypothetical protein
MKIVTKRLRVIHGRARRSNGDQIRLFNLSYEWMSPTTELSGESVIPHCYSATALCSSSKGGNASSLSQPLWRMRKSLQSWQLLVHHSSHLIAVARSVSAERYSSDNHLKRTSDSTTSAWPDALPFGELHPIAQELSGAGPSLRTLEGSSNKQVRKYPRSPRQRAATGDQG